MYFDFSEIGKSISQIQEKKIIKLLMKEKNQQVKEFLNEIVKLCKKYNLSLSHEDTHGAFIVEKYNEGNIEWLKAAFDKTS